MNTGKITRKIEKVIIYTLIAMMSIMAQIRKVMVPRIGKMNAPDLPVSPHLSRYWPWPVT